MSAWQSVLKEGPGIKTEAHDKAVLNEVEPNAALDSPGCVFSDPDSTLVDPWCNPDRPVTLDLADVLDAARAIEGSVQRTPCTRSEVLSQQFGVELHFKKEFMQATGSFKERGARYTLLRMTPEERSRGVAAASAGNHALALSYHGQQLGIRVTVVMAKVSPLMKVNRCRSYGANVIIKGVNLKEAKQHALGIAKETGAMYINGYDHPHILAGQGTIALEILKDVPTCDAVLIPVGGGGLIAGVATALKDRRPSIAVIGVESETCPSFAAAIQAGQVMNISPESTLADGLAVSTVGVNSFATCRGLIDKMVTVSEEHIALAILRLIENEKAVVEGAGAVGVAAILSGCLPELQGKRVVCLLTGGNIDTTVLGRTLERGLAVDRRLVRVAVTVSDRPGGTAEMARIIADTAASVKDSYHERAWLKKDVFSVTIKLILETHGPEHAIEVEQALIARYGAAYVKME